MYHKIFRVICWGNVIITSLHFGIPVLYCAANIIIGELNETITTHTLFRFTAAHRRNGLLWGFHASHTSAASNTTGTGASHRGSARTDRSAAYRSPSDR